MFIKVDQMRDLKLPRNRIFMLLLAAPALILFTGCPDNSDEEQRSQEQRFFDLYMASRYPDLEPQPAGIYYIEHREGTGQKPDGDDWVKFNYVFSVIPEEEVIETSLEHVAMEYPELYDADALYGPFKIQNGTMVEGFTEGLMMMREGSQATMFFTSNLGYGAKGKGQVGPYQSLKFEVELLEVIGDIETYEMNRLQSYVDTIVGADTIHDPATNAVMYYVIDEPGDGNAIAEDTLVEIVYRGSLIDGRVFDENDADDPFRFTVGEKEVIMGWEFGIRRFTEGAKGRMIIPYQLGYSDIGSKTSSGHVSVPPYETLIFEIEVVAVNSSTTGKEEPED